VAVPAGLRRRPRPAPSLSRGSFVAERVAGAGLRPTDLGPRSGATWTLSIFPCRGTKMPLASLSSRPTRGVGLEEPSARSVTCGSDWYQCLSAHSRGDLGRRPNRPHLARAPRGGARDVWRSRRVRPPGGGIASEHEERTAARGGLVAGGVVRLLADAYDVSGRRQATTYTTVAWSATVCGLLVAVVDKPLRRVFCARAFIVPEPALAKRIVRAKHKIVASGIACRLPAVDELRTRAPSRPLTRRTKARQSCAVPSSYSTLQAVGGRLPTRHRTARGRAERVSEQRALVAATVEVPRGELFLMKSTCVQLAETCRLAVRRGGFSHPEMSTLPEDSASAPQSGRRTPGWGSIMARRSSSASYPCASVIFPARKVIPHIG
jgi:hypothetical protein